MFPKSVPKALLVEAHLLVNRHRGRTASLKETYAKVDLETLISLRHRRRVRAVQGEKMLLANPSLLSAIVAVHGHRILASVQAEIDRRITSLRRQTDVRLGRRKVASDDDVGDDEDDVADDVSASDEGDEEEEPDDAAAGRPTTPEREAFFKSIEGDVEKLIAGRAAAFVRQHSTLGLYPEDVGHDLWVAVLKAWESFDLPTEGNARAAFFGFLANHGEKGKSGVGVIDGVLNNLLRKEVPRSQRRDDNRTGEAAAGEGATDRDEDSVPSERADTDVSDTGISGNRFAPTDASDRERSQQDLYIYANKESWPLLDLIFDAPELQNLPESKWLKRFFALAQEQLQLSPYEVRKILREDPAVAEFLGPKFDALEEESPEERADRKTRDKARGERMDIKKRPKTSTFDRRRLI